MSGTTTSLRQIGTWRRFVPAHQSGAFALPDTWVVAAIALSDDQIASPGSATPVRFTASYWPCFRGGYPVRGGEYRAGETAAFPQAEAEALVAAGIAELV